MPLRNVKDAMREAPTKGWSRKQAVAIGLKAQRAARKTDPRIEALRALLHAKAARPRMPTLMDALRRAR